MNIVVLESYSPSATGLLTANGHKIFNGVGEANANLKQAEILLIRSQTKITKEFLAPLNHLKLIISATSGFDHMDWRAAQEKNVVVAHTPEANAQSTAELTLTMMLAWARQLIPATQNVKQHKWRKNLLRGESLEGKSLGIVGLGRVGSRVAALAQAFGMRVYAHDPYIDRAKFGELNVECLGLMELFKTTDYVSLHVPLTKETKHLINYPTLREMTPHTVLVNLCRGSVVDESEVVVALNERVIAGALLDVLEREPPQNDSKLLSHPQIIVTPHIGAHSDKAWEKASMEAAKKAIAFAEGKDIGDTLPLKTPWFEKT